jgi:hypothetical protein
MVPVLLLLVLAVLLLAVLLLAVLLFAVVQPSMAPGPVLPVSKYS